MCLQGSRVANESLRKALTTQRSRESYCRKLHKGHQAFFTCPAERASHSLVRFSSTLPAGQRNPRTDSPLRHRAYIRPSHRPSPSSSLSLPSPVLSTSIDSHEHFSQRLAPTHRHLVIGIQASSQPLLFNRDSSTALLRLISKAQSLWLGRR